MSKALWWLVGIATGLWLLYSSDGENSRGGGMRTGLVEPVHESDQTGRYGPQTTRRISEDDDEEAQQAKQDFESAADELRVAVDGLRHHDWSLQMSRIRSRLSDADDALSELEQLRPNDSAVQTARDEIDQMRAHMTRLRYENWQHVAPALSRSSSAIEDEAAAVSDEATEE